MTVLINASPTNGLQMTSDGSGIVKLQSNSVTTNALAWVNFTGGNGNTAGIVNSSYNVSSITVNSTGDYTINYTSALSTTTYATLATGEMATAASSLLSMAGVSATKTTTTSRVICTYVNGSQTTLYAVNFAVFGN